MSRLRLHGLSRGQYEAENDVTQSMSDRDSREWLGR
jgi:hypothetical protein